MKKIFTIFMFSIFLLGVISAQEQIATPQDIQNAGITPDSPLYGIDVAIEKITELFSENAKLQHALERLAEVKVMIAQNKLRHVEKARRNFEITRQSLKNESAIGEHIKLMNDLGQKVSSVSSAGRNLTEQDFLQIKTIVEIHKENIADEVIKIEEMRKASGRVG